MRSDKTKVGGKLLSFSSYLKGFSYRCGLEFVV